jgi:hypothetical protein
MSKFKLILALTFAGLAMAATPIKDLVLQSNMDAAGFNITNAGDISNGNNTISMDEALIQVNPTNIDADFAIAGDAPGYAFFVDASQDLVRIGTHGIEPVSTNDVVLHGSVEFDDGPVSLASNVITQVGSLQFSGGSGDQGTLSWNADDETIDLNENGTTLQLGQELHIHVRNDTGTTITNGTVVAFAGTIGASSRLKASLFTADGNTQLSYLLGVATENISNGADGKVTSFGKVRGIDTSAWPEGTALYASSTTAGGFVTNAPSAPNQAVIIAYVINSHASTGSIEVILDHHNENGEGDSPWSTADSGATLYATNDVVEVRGSGLAANTDQFIISNDVSGVVFAVDEDGDTGFNTWYTEGFPETQSYLSWQAYWDFRHIVDYDMYYKIEGLTIEKMTFNPTAKTLDYQFRGDNELYLLYIDGGEDSVAIHTNVPPAGYGFAVGTNAYIHGEVEMFDNLKVQGELNASPIIYADTVNSALIVGDETLDGGGDYGLEVQTPALFNAADLVSAIVIDDVMKLDPRASAPVSGVEAGMIFYHSTSNKLFCYDGTVWNALW